MTSYPYTTNYTDGYYPDIDGYFAIGNSVYPSQLNIGQTPLQQLNPQLYYTMDFFANCLRFDIGGVWSQTVAGLQSQGLGKDFLTNICSPTYVGYDPMPFLIESNYEFPLLAIYPVEGKTTELSRTAHVKSVGQYEILFILPAVNADEMEYVAPFLLASRDVIWRRGEWMFHPLYNGGQNIGPLTGFSKAGIHGWKVCNIPAKTNLQMPTLVLNYEMYETDKDVQGLYPNTNGLDTHINLQNTNATTIDNFVEIITEN